MAGTWKIYVVLVFKKIRIVLDVMKVPGCCEIMVVTKVSYSKQLGELSLSELQPIETFPKRLNQESGNMLESIFLLAYDSMLRCYVQTPEQWAQPLHQVKNPQPNGQRFCVKIWCLMCISNSTSDCSLLALQLMITRHSNQCIKFWPWYCVLD